MPGGRAGGGIDETVAPVPVTGAGGVSHGHYPGSPVNGGFTVLELPDRAAALAWAQRIAAACRCGQDVREFMADPIS